MVTKSTKPAAMEKILASTWTATSGPKARPWAHQKARAEAGRSIRKLTPRTAHGEFEAASGRDPIAILGAQEQDRLPSLVPLRHQRMAASPFAYYRGTPAVMAFDLSSGARTGIYVQASGDAHLSNFGLFASPERTLVFDANDFDETLPAPWEWDVKRLATSCVIAGRSNGLSAAQCRGTALLAVKTYRESMRNIFSPMPLLQIWYARITEADILAAADEAIGYLKLPTSRRERAVAILDKARRRDEMRAFDHLTSTIDGRRVIVDDPPTVQHVDFAESAETINAAFEAYRSSLSEERRVLLKRYQLVDMALKVVGVGSVGTRCYVVLLEGQSEADPLILQVKEAAASVLAPYVKHVHRENEGERVVVGQRLMQSTSDIFLGWTRGPAKRDFYFRQLWDMKGSVEISALEPAGLMFYSALCGRSLARAHARSGDPVAIASYLGSGDTFDCAIADFAEAYADVNERDYGAFQAAIKEGRVTVPA